MIFLCSILVVYMVLSLDLQMSLYVFILLMGGAYSALLASSWFHVMVLLMFLEMFMLLIFLIVTSFSLMMNLSGGFIFIFITLSVAEASIGMALLTMLVRSHGNDFMNVSIF
uniref:NADH dehydrogenase subunit 4L n=1 Tax=Neocalanus robustior TaxID=197018 RepID=Q3LI89_9MAXI|nr:NADH dehydrogenase subunit 4L [Neocalanus robustior]